MRQSTAFVGLDVHKDSISVAMMTVEGEPVEIGRFENNTTAVRKMVRRLAVKHSPLAFAYEAGPCGYVLYRQLRDMGHACLVAAPSLIPKRPGNRIKTDRRDAISLAPLVRGYMAMRGIKLVTAMTLASELGDLSRFARATDLMSFVGLVASEHSSGQTRRQGGITKSGNRHVRRVLVESAWSYRHKPCWSAALRARAADASEAVRTIAWKAHKRLHKRYHRLTLMGKAGQVAVTAVAREEMGFVWAIACQVMKEQQSLAEAGV